MQGILSSSLSPFCFWRTINKNYDLPVSKRRRHDKFNIPYEAETA
jgi:hypothetical protein